MRLALTGPRQAGPALEVLLSRPSGALIRRLHCGSPHNNDQPCAAGATLLPSAVRGPPYPGFDSPYTRPPLGRLGTVLPALPAPSVGPGRWVSWLCQLLRRDWVATLMPLGPLAWALPRHPLYTLGVLLGFLPSALHPFRQTVEVPGHRQGDGVCVKHRHHSFLDFVVSCQSCRSWPGASAQEASFPGRSLG